MKSQVFKEELKTNQFILLPRFGTISPWSSKASDILINAGLKPLRRIEKGLCFSLKTSVDINEDAIKKIGQKIYDRMTQSVITTTSEAKNLFIQINPKHLIEVDKQLDKIAQAEEKLDALDSFRTPKGEN